MALRNSPLAIDGALIDSATLRIEAFMSGGRYGGVSAPADLKVRALEIPGNGLRIAQGAATVPNRYQSTPDQAYVVSNVGEHIVTSAFMPPSNASARSHLVVVTVGDPEFSQAGHPWMLASDPPLGEEQTFQYVRFHIIQNVPAGTKRFEDLGLSYPAYELARVDIPANTTTITQEMITDLREIPRGRELERIEHIAGPETPQLLNGQGGTPGQYQNFPNSVIFAMDIPLWATRAYITGFAEGIKVRKGGKAKLRIEMAGIGTTTITNIDLDALLAGKAFERHAFNLGGEIAIPEAARGTTVNVRIEGTPNNEASKGMLEADANSSGQIRVRLTEKAE